MGYAGLIMASYTLSAFCSAVALSADLDLPPHPNSKEEVIEGGYVPSDFFVMLVWFSGLLDASCIKTIPTERL